MSRKHLDLDQLMDRAIAEIRDEALSSETERAAGERVWERVRQEAEQAAEQPARPPIHNCEDFQALVPAYLQGALNEGRRMLFEDHVNECIPCRRALKVARQTRRPAAVAQANEASWAGRWGLRIAAAAVILFAVVGLSFNVGELAKVRTGGMIRVESLDGELLRVTPAGTIPVVVGEQISLGKRESLRTAKGSLATIQLEDGSAVEIRERTELAVRNESWFWNRAEKDGVIDLARGSVIVGASDQGSGHLYVETDDSVTTVKGTVFAVNNGIKGTRVSVIEGEVHVEHGGNRDVLHPGDQTTTQADLARIPVADEIAWSANSDRYVQLLAELTELGHELDAVLHPELRYSSDMLALAPAGTVVFAGIPNVTGSLDEAHAILQQRVAQSPALKQWWDENVVANGIDTHIDDAVKRVSAYGAEIGDEIALVLTMDTEGQVQEPLLLARLEGREAFRALVESDIERIRAARSATDGGDRHDLVIVEGDSPDPGTDDADMFLWLGDDVMALAFSGDAIRATAAAAGNRAAPATDVDGLRGQLDATYAKGVEFVVGVDLERILGANIDDTEETRMAGLGLLDMQYLIGERSSVDNRTENRVELSFTRERRGLAAWIDEPAPMGALDFISPGATLAGGFVMQDPTTLVDQLFDVFRNLDENFDAHLAEFESEHGVSVRDDFVAPLGGEVAFAMDGPLLPTPAWKLILEVYDPAQLQQTLEWAVGQVNGFATEAGKKGFEITSESANGLEWFRLESLDTAITVQYVFVDGYMLAGPSRAVLQSAIDTRDSGLTLVKSDGFRSMLPRDGQVNFSGVVYQNLGALLGPLASLGEAAARLSPEQANLARELSTNSHPSLTVAYGGPDRLTFVYTHEGGFFSSALTSFFSFRSLMGVQQLVGDSLRHG